MKITTFNPLILSPKAEEIIKLFEELGFEKRHMKDNIDGQDITSIRMTDSNGFHVDVGSSNNIDRDLMAIRMNVDDFEEGLEFLKSHGFVNVLDHVVNTGSSKFAIMKSPSGFTFDLCQHMKDHN